MIQEMQKMTDLHDQLLEIAEQKSEVLVRNQVSELTKFVSQENKLVKQIGEREQDFVAAAASFIRSKGIEPTANITMDDIIKLLFNPEEKESLIEVREQLLDRVDQLKAKNSRNQKLIEMSLAYIDLTLDLMTGSEQDVVYHKPDTQAPSKKKLGIFDAKA